MGKTPVKNSIRANELNVFSNKRSNWSKTHITESYQRQKRFDIRVSTLMQ